MALTHRPAAKSKRDKQDCLSLVQQLCNEQKIHQIRSRNCHGINPAIAITEIERLPTFQAMAAPLQGIDSSSPKPIIACITFTFEAVLNEVAYMQGAKYGKISNTFVSPSWKKGTAPFDIFFFLPLLLFFLFSSYRVPFPLTFRLFPRFFFSLCRLFLHTVHRYKTSPIALLIGPTPKDDVSFFWGSYQAKTRGFDAAHIWGPICIHRIVAVPVGV